MDAVKCGLLLFLVAGCASLHDAAPLAQSRQLIVVTSPSWDAIDGELRRYERARTDDAWRPAGDAIPVVLGRTGLAWGRGIAPVPATAPQKREGDGKSPAGAFTLGDAFGFDTSAQTKMRYAMLRDTTECVDDAGSQYYNEIVDRDRVPRVDWTSSEKMRAIDQYRRGIVVNHNVPGERGGGSCIFLHVWSGPSRPTAGCTAMRAEDLDAILRWLDPAAKPIVLQLPRDEYARMREVWRLPDAFLTNR